MTQQLIADIEHGIELGLTYQEILQLARRKYLLSNLQADDLFS